MRFITCSGYFNTGSSAVTDFVSEFSNVFDFTNEEFRFIQDPDGISDLEFNLVECFNRHNSGHALKRYKKLVDFYSGNIFGKKYTGFFGDKWKELSYKYIDELTDFTFRGWWVYDLYDRGKFYHFRKRIVNKLLHKTIWRNKPDRQLNTMKNEITMCSHPTEEKFLKVTRKYISDLFSSVLIEDKDILMVDQLLPPNNTKRYIRYFDNNIINIVVDRDPRDVFILEKYEYKSGIIPSDVEVFCRWYDYTRSHRNTEDMNTDFVHFIMFEDLIYNYEETTKKIIQWLSLDESKHDRSKEKFIPEISIKNTQTWKKYPEGKKEAEYIENHLTDYLYNFPG